MSIRISDRVKETSLTTGTGTLTLAGAFSTAFDTFAHGITSGQTFYVIENPAGWETGIGTVAGSTLSRDTVLSSSAGGALVTLIGTSIVFCGQSALKSVFMDSSGNLDLSRASGIVFPDGSLQTVAGGSPVAISGWADSTMSARDVLVSGWAGANDIAISGWANSNDITMSGWTQASDVALSGWANFRDSKVTTALTTLIAGVSGWADLAMSARDTLISGWAASSFAPVGLSGWALRTFTNSGIAYLANDATISGWAQSTFNGLVSPTTVSGWASQTIVNSSNALTTAYVAADTVVTNAFAAADSTISGWMDRTLTNSGVAFLANDTTISGWASSTIVNSGNVLKATIDASGNAVSGWAQSTFDGIPSAASISGWAWSTLVNSGNAIIASYTAADAGISGWAQSTFDGIVSANAVSGWASQTIINSGQNIISSYIAADSAISGWANSRDTSISGWVQSSLTGNLIAVNSLTATGTLNVSGAATFAGSLTTATGSVSANGFVIGANAGFYSAFVNGTALNLYGRTSVNIGCSKDLNGVGGGSIASISFPTTSIAALSFFNISTTAQAAEFQILGLYTTTGNIQKMVFRLPVSGNATIGTEKGGAGLSQGLIIETAGTAALTIDTSQVATFASNVIVSVPSTTANSVAVVDATQTLTNKRITPRASGMSNAGTSPFINTDLTDIFTASGQTVNISSFTTNLTGTPTPGQLLWIAVAGASGAITLAFGASFESSTITLPTTTVSTARLDMGFIWNAATSKWRLIAQA